MPTGKSCDGFPYLAGLHQYGTVVLPTNYFKICARPAESLFTNIFGIFLAILVLVHEHTTVLILTYL